MRNAVKRWGDYKSKFVSRQLLAEVLTIKNFDDDLITKYEHAVFQENKAQDTAWREVVTRIVKTRRPKKAVAECQKEWLAYLEILIETILDYGGETSILEVLSIHRKHQEVVQIREGTALNQSGSSTEGGPPAPR